MGREAEWGIRSRESRGERAKWEHKIRSRGYLWDMSETSDRGSPRNSKGTTLAETSSSGRYGAWMWHLLSSGRTSSGGKRILTPHKTFNLNFSAYKLSRDTEGAKIKGMLNQRLPLLETHPTGENKSLTLLMLLCCALRQKPSKEHFSMIHLQHWIFQFLERYKDWIMNYKTYSRRE